MRNPCPTFHDRRKISRKKVRAIAKSGRANVPDIYVKCIDPVHSWRDPYARAHLRNKRGYVYLSWRDGGTVRTFYLGKAPRSSPTESAGGAPDQVVEASSKRRGKRS
jgi:hypothetical protein